MWVLPTASQAPRPVAEIEMSLTAGQKCPLEKKEACSHTWNQFLRSLGLYPCCANNFLLIQPDVFCPTAHNSSRGTLWFFVLRMSLAVDIVFNVIVNTGNSQRLVIA